MKKKVCLILFSILPFLTCCNSTPDPKDDFKLGTPNISLTNDKLSWESIPNADYYAVYEKNEVYKYVQENYLNLNITINGNYEFSVQALTFGLTYESSNISNKIAYSISLTELGEPTISISDGAVKWEKVPNATGYSLFVDNKKVKQPNFTYENNTIKWKLADLESAGKHKINVSSLSNIEGCETESDKSNSVDVTVSENKKWIPDDIITEWQNKGGVSLDNEQILINSLSKEVEISNLIVVDSVKPYLNIEFGNIIESTKETKAYVYLNDQIIKENTSSTDYFIISDNAVARYNLSAFVNKIVYIKVVFAEGMKIRLDNIHFVTKDDVSPFDSWNTTNYKEDWSTEGTVRYHEEGICLESSKGNSSITNKVKVNSKKPYFTLLLRKFEREGSQDENPESYLYVNDVLLSPVGLTYPVLTATSDNPNKYTFDFTGYINQTVEIKIVNVKGEHACFPKMYFSDKGAYSIKSYWDIDLIQEEWDFSGTVQVHEEGVCLHNNGAESSMINKIKLSDNAYDLVISFRKFLRDDEQDKDPKIKVYINNVLTKAVGVEEDYVTVHSNDYHSFTYDLDAFKGQIVTIRITNVEGEHACFNCIYIADRGY